MPTGPYQVGVTTYDLNDTSRRKIKFPAGRLIPIQIYFPKDSGVHKVSEKIFEKRVPKIFPPLENKVYGVQSELSKINCEKKHAIILFSHGNNIAMTDYAYLFEDLASHGYVVITIQHQLHIDTSGNATRQKHSIARYNNIINNIRYVYKWITQNKKTIFLDSINLKNIGLIGHSMGGNALLLLADRTAGTCEKSIKKHILSQDTDDKVRETIVLLDPTAFFYPLTNPYPMLLLFPHERESIHKAKKYDDYMIKSGHKAIYYEGAKHISFMDHGYINPKNPIAADEPYFNGTVEERKKFFDMLRKDIRNFLNAQGIFAHS